MQSTFLFRDVHRFVYCRIVRHTFKPYDLVDGDVEQIPLPAVIQYDIAVAALARCKIQPIALIPVVQRSCIIVSRISVEVLLMTSPLSRPSAMYMRVTPVSLSPSMMARWIGAPPLCLGSRDAWTLNPTGHSKQCLRQYLPIGRVMIRSQPHPPG